MKELCLYKEYYLPQHKDICLMHLLYAHDKALLSDLALKQNPQRYLLTLVSEQEKP